VALAAAELARWGFRGEPRADGEPADTLNARSVTLTAYEMERPTADVACRIGDARLLEIRQRADG
jgi:hydrogenase maturation protease